MPHQLALFNKEDDMDAVEQAMKLALMLLTQAKERKEENEFGGARAMGLLSEFQITPPIGDKF